MDGIGNLKLSKKIVFFQNIIHFRSAFAFVFSLAGYFLSDRRLQTDDSNFEMRLFCKANDWMFELMGEFNLPQ